MTSGGVPLPTCRVNLCQLITPQWGLLSLFSLSVWVLATAKHVKEEGKINWVKVFVWNVDKTPRNGRKKILVGSDQPRGTHHLLSTSCFMWGYWQCCIEQTRGHFNHIELPRCWGWNPSFSFLYKAVARVLADEGSQIVLEEEHLQFSETTTLCGVTHCLMSRRLCAQNLYITG